MPILGITASAGDRNVPGAPTIGTATDVGTGRAYNNGAATVTFTAPTYTGNTPITGYTVTSSPGGFTGTAASSPVTVTGLQSSTSYTFTVTATNAQGTSPASSASNSVTATTVPQAPTIGTAADGGTGTTATVTYTANATGGKAVSAYTATSSPGSITGTGTSPITVSGLTAGTAYTFTVTATNANGTSSASSASNSVTPSVPGSYEFIASVIGEGSSFAFTSIPQTYTALEIRVMLAGSSNGQVPNLNFNSDTSNSYQNNVMTWCAGAFALFGQMSSNINLLPNTNGLRGTNPFPYVGIFTIENYSSTTQHKICSIEGGVATPTANYSAVVRGGYAYGSNTAITSVAFNGYFGPGSAVELYGIKGS
jgi:hypothetical protein